MSLGMARLAATKRAQQLQKSLYQLQASGSAVWRDMRRTNRAFYAHVAAVYFWWRQASGVCNIRSKQFRHVANTLDKLRSKSGNETTDRSIQTGKNHALYKN